MFDYCIIFLLLLAFLFWILWLVATSLSHLHICLYVCLFLFCLKLSFFIRRLVIRFSVIWDDTIPQSGIITSSKTFFPNNIIFTGSRDLTWKYLLGNHHPNHYNHLLCNSTHLFAVLSFCTLHPALFFFKTFVIISHCNILLATF